MSLTEVIADRVKHHRNAKGWSQTQLVGEMAALGYPLDRASLSNIERGKTRADNTTVREVLVLAAALDVPPVLLFIPLGVDTDVSLTPTVSVDAHLAYRWVIGEEPFCHRDAAGYNIARHPADWTVASVPVRMHAELVRLQKEVDWAHHHTQAKGELAPGVQDRYDDALRAYVQHRRAMRLSGLDPQWIPEEWAARAAELGLSDRIDEGGNR